MENNLTRGPIVKTLLVFTLPYFLASFLQTFYGMADLFIVGRFCDTASVNAVSIGSQFMHMVTVIIIGLAVGITVKTGFLVGQDKKEEVNGIIANGWRLFALLSLLMIVVLVPLCSSLVDWLSVPRESRSYADIYLRICFFGIPFICAFNALAALFRGLGDSKSPMLFVAVSCFINIFLDWLLVGPMGMGAMGAAVATIFAQGCSVLFGLYILMKKDFGFQIRFSGSKASFAGMLDLLKLGGPIAAQDGFIQVSFMVITVIANARGLVFSTGVGITEKIISFLFLVPSAFLSSLSAIVAQNQGAGCYARSRKMLFTAMAMACTYGFACFVICQFASPFLLSLFSRDPAVVTAGADYLRAYSLDCCLAGSQFCFSGYFAGIEKPAYSFIHNVISVLAARIPISWLASIYFPSNLYPMGLAAPIGSGLSVLICIAFYVHLRHQQKLALASA